MDSSTSPRVASIIRNHFRQPITRGLVTTSRGCASAMAYQHSRNGGTNPPPNHAFNRTVSGSASFGAAGTTVNLASLGVMAEAIVRAP